MARSSTAPVEVRLAGQPAADVGQPDPGQDAHPVPPAAAQVRRLVAELCQLGRPARTARWPWSPAPAARRVGGQLQPAQQPGQPGLDGIEVPGRDAHSTDTARSPLAGHGRRSIAHRIRPASGRIGGMAHRLTTVTAPDGRALGVAQWGDPDGSPVFGLHGTPGSRFGHPPDEAADSQRAGLRVVTYDRPGYGVSDRRPGRRVVDCAEDVAAIADALGIDRFAVHRRVRRRAARAGGGRQARRPGDGCRVPGRRRSLRRRGPGLVGRHGPAERPGVRLGDRRRAVSCTRRLAPLAEADLVRIAKDPSKILSDDWELAAADRRSLPARRQRVFVEGMRAAYTAGVWGRVDDDLAFVTGWGFTLDEIAVPVTVRYGAQDVLVPAGTAPGWARTSPDAKVVVHADGGHVIRPRHQIEELRRSSRLAERLTRPGAAGQYGLRGTNSGESALRRRARRLGCGIDSYRGPLCGDMSRTTG